VVFVVCGAAIKQIAVDSRFSCDLGSYPFPVILAISILRVLCFLSSLSVTASFFVIGCALSASV